MEKKLPQHRHFDVRMETVDAKNATKLQSNRDYLRIYYSDFLYQRRGEGPKYAKSDQSQIESDDLQDWVLRMQPRSRVDCYPLYLLTKELLQQLALGKCEVISSELSALQSSLAEHR